MNTGNCHIPTFLLFERTHSVMNVNVIHSNIFIFSVGNHYSLLLFLYVKAENQQHFKFAYVYVYACV